MTWFINFTVAPSTLRFQFIFWALSFINAAHNIMFSHSTEECQQKRCHHWRFRIADKCVLWIGFMKFIRIYCPPSLKIMLPYVSWKPQNNKWNIQNENEFKTLLNRRLIIAFKCDTIIRSSLFNFYHFHFLCHISFHFLIWIKK